MTTTTIKTPAALTEKQHALLSFFQQEWLLNGAIPSREKCTSSGICNDQFYTSTIKLPTFRIALDVRGISPKALDSVSGMLSKGLTEQQLVCANIMLDLLDNRSQRKKLQELSIPTQTYQSWLRDPAYQEYIRARSENLLGDNQHEAHLALLDRVTSGDMVAIKYYNEITGRFTPQQANGGANVREVLQAVITIIQRHVIDPNTLTRIAEDLLALSSAPESAERVNSTPYAPKTISTVLIEGEIDF